MCYSLPVIIRVPIIVVPFISCSAYKDQSKYLLNLQKNSSEKYTKTKLYCLICRKYKD